MPHYSHGVRCCLLVVVVLSRVRSTLTAITTLIAQAQKGDTELQVASTVGFQIGDVINIGGKEFKQITHFASIVLDSPLQHSYSDKTEITTASAEDASRYRVVTTTEKPKSTEPSAMEDLGPTSSTRSPMNSTTTTTGVLDSSAAASARLDSINSMDASLYAPLPATRTAPNTGFPDREDPVSLPCAALENLTLAPDGGKSPLGQYMHDFGAWLASHNDQNESRHQELIAGGALVIGALIAWDGPAIWRALFVLAVAGAGASIVRLEDQAFFRLVQTEHEEWILFVEAAIAIAFAVNIGFEGSQIFFGLIVGVWGSYETAHLANKLDSLLHGFAPLLWYSVGGVLGMCLFLCWRRPVLAALSPILGGLLIANSVGFLISCGLTLVSKLPPWLSQLPLFFPVASEAWISSCAALLGDKNPAFNIALPCCLSLVGICAHKYLHSSRRISKITKVLPTSIVIFGIVASTGWRAYSLGCKVAPPSCPAEAPWRWLLSGSFLWLLVVVPSTLHHLTLLELLGNDFRMPFYMRQLKKASEAWYLDWNSLPDEHRRAAAVLGWNKDMWDTEYPRGRPVSSSKQWYNLTTDERQAAGVFGWTQTSWDTHLWLEDGQVQDTSDRELLLADYNRSR